MSDSECVQEINEDPNKRRSKIINIVVGVLIIPMLPISGLAGFGTLMVSDPGNVNEGLLLVVAFLFLAMPLVMGFTTIVSPRWRGGEIKIQLSDCCSNTACGIRRDDAVPSAD